MGGYFGVKERYHSVPQRESRQCQLLVFVDFLERIETSDVDNMGVVDGPICRKRGKVTIVDERNHTLERQELAMWV